VHRAKKCRNIWEKHLARMQARIRADGDHLVEITLVSGAPCKGRGRALASAVQHTRPLMRKMVTAGCPGGPRLDLDRKWLMLMHIQVSLEFRCQISLKMLGLSCRARCLDLILCSSAFGIHCNRETCNVSWDCGEKNRSKLPIPFHINSLELERVSRAKWPNVKTCSLET